MISTIKARSKVACCFPWSLWARTTYNPSTQALENTLGHSKGSQLEDLRRTSQPLQSHLESPSLHQEQDSNPGLQQRYLSAASNMCWQALSSLTFP